MGVSSSAAEYKSMIGLDDLYIAPVTQDDANGYVTGTPEWLAPAGAISQQPTVSDEVQYADNQPYDTLHSEGETKADVTITGLSAEMHAKILGYVFDATTGRVLENGGTPPYVALGFRTKKSNGSYRYYWFLKGRFSAPKEDADTQADKATPKTLQLTFTALKSIYKWTVGSVTDGFKRVWGDADTASFSGTTWFNQVQVPGATSPSALALSSSTPAANATGVVVSSNITLTFNNALAADAITNVIITTAAGAYVASTNSLDTAKKVMTLDPDSSMAGATVHIVSYGVTDVYAQTLRGSFKFTTA